MLAADLAEIYGYSTKKFNQQVKNNIEKFEEDFRFQLTPEETFNLRSKFLTANINPMSRYEPYVFTEAGIYMLMTVLKGELATNQSKALIRAFKAMKDYIQRDPMLAESSDLARLSIQVAENARDIYEIKTAMATKDDLTKVINVPTNVEIIIFSDNLNIILRLTELQAFRSEYPNVRVSFRKTGGKFHDRYIIIDYKQQSEKIYHCGASSKDAGNKITTIMKSDNATLYYPMVDNLLSQPDLKLR